MSKRKTSTVHSYPEGRKAAKDPQAATPSAGGWPSHFPSPTAIREMVESIVVAFVLAFLFRTFEAEAFVIPTGSMAPTLMGRHKDLLCPVCGYEYQVSATEKENKENISSGTCPMCRFPANIIKDRSYSGDRILVSKFAYQFREPNRWDVVVFKYPNDPTTNYIKRLVGRPGETIWVYRGDLWVCPGGGEFEIARKESPQKLLAMFQPVFDNDLAPKINARGWPPRWQAETPANGDPPGWTAPDEKSFETDGATGQPEWIRYRHLVPTYGQWDDKEQGRETSEPRRQLISDFTAYNTGSPGPVPQMGGKMGARPAEVDGYGQHWVGDLALECRLETRSAAGRVVFELVRGGRRFQCGIDLTDGKATMRIGGLGDQEFAPTAPTPLGRPGKHTVMFCNVDDQLRLLVDGNEIQFNALTIYDSRSLRVHVPTPEDLSPVGIGAQGASIRVDHLRIFRDIYYIAEEAPGRKPITDFRGQPPDLASPRTWEAFEDHNINGEVKFELAPPDSEHPENDQFLVMGDNSAQSKDCRLWGVPGANREFWVRRDLLVGKAFFIYWPHPWHKLPFTPIPFPYFPNFERMHRVR